MFAGSVGFEETIFEESGSTAADVNSAAAGFGMILQKRRGACSNLPSYDRQRPAIRSAATSLENAIFHLQRPTLNVQPSVQFQAA